MSYWCGNLKRDIKIFYKVVALWACRTRHSAESKPELGDWSVFSLPCCTIKINTNVPSFTSLCWGFTGWGFTFDSILFWSSNLTFIHLHFHIWIIIYLWVANSRAGYYSRNLLYNLKKMWVLLNETWSCLILYGIYVCDISNILVILFNGPAMFCFRIGCNDYSDTGTKFDFSERSLKN